jgi:lipoprotein signal peptidase
MDIIKFAIPGTLVFAVDQAIKTWVNTNLMILERLPLAGQSFYMLSRSLNPGIALGIGGGADVDSRMRIWLTFIAPVSAIVLILAIWVVLMTRVIPDARLNNRDHLAFSALLGGALSNILDQSMNRFATDSFQLYVGSGTYLPHNLADIAIVTGLALLSVGFTSRFLRSEAVPQEAHSSTYSRP